MRQKKTSSKAASGTAAVNRRRLLNNESPFAIKEAYVKLRTSLMFCMTADKERTCKTFAVTSSKPSEGKSLTAANVAISYAMLGKKVLLIDAGVQGRRHDRRGRYVHGLFRRLPRAGHGTADGHAVCVHGLRHLRHPPRRSSVHPPDG